MFSNTVQKLTVGTVGIVSSEGIPEIIDVVATQPSEVVSIIVQIIIGIATLFGLFKKEKVAK